MDLICQYDIFPLHKSMPIANHLVWKQIGLNFLLHYIHVLSKRDGEIQL